MRHTHTDWMMATIICIVATTPRVGAQDQSEAAYEIPHITPVVIADDLLDVVINTHANPDALRALQNQHAGQWSRPETKHTWSIQQWQTALQCDRNFKKAVAGQQLDPSGRIAYTVDLAWCERAAVWMPRMFPSASPLLANEAISPATTSIPDDPDELAMAAHLAADELAAMDGVLASAGDHSAVAARLNVWRSARLQRLIWQKQRVAAPNSAAELDRTSGGLSVFIPVSSWIRSTAGMNDTLSGLCSGMEHELAQLWLQYQQKLATTLRRKQDDDEDNAELFAIWRLLVATEQDSIALLLAAAEDANLPVPRSIRLIARGVGTR